MIAVFDGTKRALYQSRVRKERLRQSLADPQRRAEIRADRIRQARIERPELARVLQVDTATEERLFNLLADHQLSIELQPDPNPYVPEAPDLNPLLSVAQEHTQRMREIGAIVGTDKLDAYVDYISTVQWRQAVEHFDATLPTANQLAFEQKDALVVLMYQDGLRRGARPGLGHPQQFPPTSGVTRAERRRQMELQTLSLNEASRLRVEADQLGFVEQARSLLTVQQAEVFAAQQQLEVDRARAERERDRRALGLSLDEPLPQPVAAPVLTANLRLQLELDVNATHTAQTLRSVRGASVSFAGPEGLWVQARPALIDRDTLELELRFFETRNNERRLLGCTAIDSRVGSAGKPASYQTGRTATVFVGRKGYAVGWTYSASYE